jgi:hypothetical protein
MVLAPENNPDWSEKDPRRVREQYLSGSDRWRAGLDVMADKPMVPIPYDVLGEAVNGRWRDVFRAWKRHNGGSWSSRPLHIAERADGVWVGWMDPTQAMACRGARNHG